MLSLVNMLEKYPISSPSIILKRVHTPLISMMPDMFVYACNQMVSESGMNDNFDVERFADSVVVALGKILFVGNVRPMAVASSCVKTALKLKDDEKPEVVDKRWAEMLNNMPTLMEFPKNVDSIMLVCPVSVRYVAVLLGELLEIVESGAVSTPDTKFKESLVQGVKDIIAMVDTCADMLIEKDFIKIRIKTCISFIHFSSAFTRGSNELSFAFG